MVPNKQYLVQNPAECGPRDYDLHRPARAANHSELRQRPQTIRGPVPNAIHDVLRYVCPYTPRWEF